MRTFIALGLVENMSELFNRQQSDILIASPT